MQRLRVLIVLAALAAVAADQPAPPEGPVQPGSAFPPMTVQALQPGASGLAAVDLSASLGKRPIVILYFMLGESLGEEAFLHLEALAGKLGDKAAVYGAINLGRRYSLAEAVDRLTLLGATIPVIVEDDLALARRLGVAAAPSINLIDGKGVFQIREAKSLKQQVSRGMTMSGAIESAARGGPTPTVARLPRYYPAEELVGEPFPDFILKQFQSADRIKMSDLAGKAAAEGKITALLFWHPNCPHCKRVMPGIVTAWHSYEKFFEVVSVANLANANEERNAADTIRAHGMGFPVLVDEGKRVSELYKVVSTPTMFFIRPDGVVDSVYTSGNVNYVPVFQSRIRAILRQGKSGG